jgi:hypothetical protein
VFSQALEPALPQRTEAGDRREDVRSSAIGENAASGRAVGRTASCCQDLGTSLAAADADGPQTPRNWLTMTACRPKMMVHSGGHKPLPAFLGNPCFTGFLASPRRTGGNPSLPPSLLSFDDPLGLAFLFRGIRRIHFCISPPMPLVRRYRLAEDRDLEARVNKRPKVTPPSLGGSIV